jgi:hypothetical protein
VNNQALPISILSIPSAGDKYLQGRPAPPGNTEQRLALDGNSMERQISARACGTIFASCHIDKIVMAALLRFPLWRGLLFQLIAPAIAAAHPGMISLRKPACISQNYPLNFHRT